MKLRELLKGMEVLHTEGSLDIPISMIHYDSRRVTPGSLFFCIEGYNADGHDYAAMAVDKGAVAVLLRNYQNICIGYPQVHGAALIQFLWKSHGESDIIWGNRHQRENHYKLYDQVYFGTGREEDRTHWYHM